MKDYKIPKLLSISIPDTLYRQTTGKAADKFFDQAAGKIPNVKNDGKMTGEHAGIGRFGVEARKTGFAANSYGSTACGDILGSAKRQKSPLLRDRDSNPD